MISVDDYYSQYAIDHDALGRVKKIDNEFTPGSPRVIQESQYDARSNRVELKSQINGRWDNIIGWQFDGLSRVTRIQQRTAGATGLPGVAPKQVNLDYDIASQVYAIRRYTKLGDNLAALQFHLAVNTSVAYTSAGPVSYIAHRDRNGGTLATYEMRHDAALQVTRITSSADGVSNFGYDATSQLVSADHATQTDEFYDFDANGNRDDSHLHGTAYTTHADNLLVSDGVWNYVYDFEGNRLSATRANTDPSNSHRLEYVWDHRNRLSSVTHKNNAGTPTKRIDYIYDVFDRKIGRKISTNGDGIFEKHEWFSYDGDQIALAFTDLDGDGPGVSSLTNRYLNGPEVDQVFFDEQLNANGSFKDLFEPLADHLGTIRDIAKRNANGTTSIVNHIRYDSFGNILSESNAAVDHIFGYTGQIWDADALLYDYNARWYDPMVGRFTGEDPITFLAGDTNLNRYVGNNPVNYTDPTGFAKSGLLDEIADDVALAVTQAAKQFASDMGFRPLVNAYDNYHAAQASAERVDALEQAGHGTAAAIGINALNKLGEIIGVGDVTSAYAGKNLAGDDLTGPATLYRGGLGLIKVASTVVGGRAAVKAGLRPVPPRVTSKNPSGTVQAQLVKTAAERAKEVHETMDARAQRCRTTAVTETAEGTRVVSSSIRRLTPSQRAALLADEVEGVGRGHAEVTGMEAARKMGLSPTGTAASRPICPKCARALHEHDVVPLSPLKQKTGE